MITDYMNLTLPSPSISIGPAWATTLNDALELIDAHDHSSGKGTQVPSSGLNINASVDFDTNSIANLLSAKFTSQAATLTGASNASSIYVKGGDLYYTNSSGSAVQITSGGAIATAAASEVLQDVSSDLIILNTDTFTYLTIDTSVARQITLPSASAVSAGRYYILKDKSGTCNTNNITIVRAGSDTIDGATSHVIDSDYSSKRIVSNGVSAWYVS